MFVSPKRNFVSFGCQSLCIPSICSFWYLLLYSRSVQICPFWTLHMNGGHLTHVWLLSVIVFWSFSRAIVCVNTSVFFFFFCNQTLLISLVYLVFCLSVHWWTLAYFHLTDAMDSHIQVSVWTRIFISLGRAGDSTFKCLKIFQVVLRSGSAPPLHLPTGNSWRFWFFRILSNSLPLPLFVKSHILVGEWYLAGVWSASLWWLMARSIFLCALWLCLLLDLCDSSFT